MCSVPLITVPSRRDLSLWAPPSSRARLVLTVFGIWTHLSYAMIRLENPSSQGAQTGRHLCWLLGIVLSPRSYLIGAFGNYILTTLSVGFLDGQARDLTVGHTGHVATCGAVHADHRRQAHVLPSVPRLRTALL